MAVRGRIGPALVLGLVVACAASMVHFRWTILEPAALRYGLVAVGTVGALLLAWVVPTVTAHPSFTESEEAHTAR